MLSPSTFLSLMSACPSVHSSCSTWTRSKTTRRSTPRWMSRLRSPMSKSTTHVERPRWARPVAKEAADVVLPTPPFPEVMQTIRPRDGVSSVAPGEWSTSEGWDSTNGWDGEEAKKRPRGCCCCGRRGGNRCRCCTDASSGAAAAWINPPGPPPRRCAATCRERRPPGGESRPRREAWWLGGNNLDRGSDDREEWRRILCERREIGGVIAS
mmetsp:Transcript_24867/g.52994  ORF Transcript_24867/g.52994 Transcript_24867/m.52994 type:complete len:211 (+) Transcript_24867:958-1590(+)